MVDTTPIARHLHTLLSELLYGAPRDASYMLNGGDPGILRSLDRISAAAASRSPTGGAPIAAHVEHLRYGFSLFNRWAAGEHPFEDAKWASSWERTTVTDAEWKELRADLAAEAARWLEAIGVGRDVTDVELNWVIGSIAHLAYHVGAIRQIDRAARGPAAND